MTISTTCIRSFIGSVRVDILMAVLGVRRGLFEVEEWLKLLGSIVVSVER